MKLWTNIHTISVSLEDNIIWAHSSPAGVGFFFVEKKDKSKDKKIILYVLSLACLLNLLWPKHEVCEDSLETEGIKILSWH